MVTCKIYLIKLTCCFLLKMTTNDLSLYSNSLAEQFYWDIQQVIENKNKLFMHVKRTKLQTRFPVKEELLGQRSANIEKPAFINVVSWGKLMGKLYILHLSWDRERERRRQGTWLERTESTNILWHIDPHGWLCLVRKSLTYYCYHMTYLNNV